MPVKTYESQDAIPEAQRESAIETKDGKFVVVEDEDVSGLKTVLADQKEKARKAAQKAKELEAKLAEMEQEVTAGKIGLSSDKLAELRRQAEDKFKADLEERDRLKQELRTLRLDSSVKSLLAKAEAVDVDDAWSIIGSQFDLTEDGKPILKADPTADIEKYIQSLRSSKGHLFKGSQASGGGANGGKAAGAPSGSKPASQWTADERAQYEAQHGEGSFRRVLDAQLREALKPKPKAA
jgi:hypothetical protein